MVKMNISTLRSVAMSSFVCGVDCFGIYHWWATNWYYVGSSVVGALLMAALVAGTYIRVLRSTNP